MIEIRNLSKVYKMHGGVPVNALNKVNLTVGDGEFLAVMGSSGSGKSTLLHMIAAVDAPTSGSVTIEGSNIHKLKRSEQAVLRRRKVGIIYQAYNLIPTLTVEENLILPMVLDKRCPSGELRKMKYWELLFNIICSFVPGFLAGIICHWGIFKIYSAEYQMVWCFPLDGLLLGILVLVFSVIITWSVLKIYKRKLTLADMLQKFE